MRVISIVGARPNFIKHNPLSKEIRKEMDEIVIHTGQHYDYRMNQVFFDELGILKPDYHLEVGSGYHGHQTGEMIKRIEKVLIKEEPDVVIVYGDTNTTLAGALTATKLHIKVAHVEAGLRSFDKRMPEEINRILTDHCSDLLFCPTDTAVKNLESEAITNGVHLVGDVMLDALNDNIKIAERNSNILEELKLKPKDYYLATVHRTVNTDDFTRLKTIVDAFCEIEDLVLPCHPRTEKFLRNFGLWDKLDECIKITKPVGYLDMLVLEKNAKKILTDSGGMQKEAYFFGVACLTLRDTTEWVDTIENGWNVLVGADRDRIIKMKNNFEPSLNTYTEKFGKAKASKKIKKLILKYI